jgi:hypothetical protein
MLKATLLGILRHVLTFGGGWLVAEGYATAGTADEVVGTVITLAGLIWSTVEKGKYND